MVAATAQAAPVAQRPGWFRTSLVTFAALGIGGGVVFVAHLVLFFFRLTIDEELLLYAVAGSGSLLLDMAQLLPIVLLVAGLLWAFAHDCLPHHCLRPELLLPLLAIVLGIASSAAAGTSETLIAIVVLVPIVLVVALRHAILMPAVDRAWDRRGASLTIPFLAAALLAVTALRYESPPLEVTDVYAQDRAHLSVELSNVGTKRLVLQDARAAGSAVHGRVVLRAQHWSWTDSGSLYGRPQAIERFEVPADEGVFIEAQLSPRACRRDEAPSRIEAIEIRYALGDRHFTERVTEELPAYVRCR